MFTKKQLPNDFSSLATVSASPNIRGLYLRAHTKFNGTPPENVRVYLGALSTIMVRDIIDNITEKSYQNISKDLNRLSITHCFAIVIFSFLGALLAEEYVDVNMDEEMQNYNDTFVNLTDEETLKVMNGALHLFNLLSSTEHQNIIEWMERTQKIIEVWLLNAHTKTLPDEQLLKGFETMLNALFAIIDEPHS